jgi:hypothetical protein
LLFQDGHVSSVCYARTRPNPVNTAQNLLWYPGEPITVNPQDHYEDNWYPCQPPPSFQSTPPGDTFPKAMSPTWYTRTHRWTLITHK